MSLARLVLACALVCAVATPAASAVRLDPPASAAAAPGAGGASLGAAVGASAATSGAGGLPSSADELFGGAPGREGEGGDSRLATAVEIAVLLTVLALLPAVLITVTSFTRIVIVLSFVRRALSVNELPPNPVLLGLALFLTTFVMGPVVERIGEAAWKPYRAGELGAEEAAGLAWRELSGFLLANTRDGELDLFADLSRTELPEGGVRAMQDPPLRVVVPAFVLSELKTAFQMGFLLFLPFLVIDLVVSSILLSMGMFMLPPVMISTPFKILLFVLVDGWHLVCESLVTSFVTT